MQLANKVVVVTGAGSGIGRALTFELGHHGAKVACIDYNTDALNETGELLAAQGINCCLHTVDISNQKQVETLPAAIKAALGAPEIIINNAGVIQPYTNIAAMDITQIERVFNVNFWGTVFMVKSFLPYLQQQPESYIVNVSSMGGMMPFPKQTAYGASKAAVKLLTEGLLAELKDSTTQVAAVYPGGVRTNITQNAPDICDNTKARVQEIQKKMDFGVTAEAAARKIVDGIARDKKRILIGADINILDKLYRLAPISAARLLCWMMSKAPLP